MMDRTSTSPGVPVSGLRFAVPALADLGLIELRSGSPLVAQVRRDGALFAFRHRETLLNQLLPPPTENGLFRLFVRHWGHGGVDGATSLVGVGLEFHELDATAAQWVVADGRGLACTTTLRLHPKLAAWAWQVVVTNTTPLTQRIDLVLGQDLGLGDEGSVRNNEAYTSHYIDLLPVDDPSLGWTILARQNQPATGGRHPWLAVACIDGAASYCTDGWQFFGADHRMTGEPAAVRVPALPSQRLQYECAFAGLQSRPRELAPGASARITFVARFLEDHPAASAAEDLAVLREPVSFSWVPGPGGSGLAPPSEQSDGRSLFLAVGWLHGDQPSETDWEAWFPGRRRHEEITTDGRVLSFFHGACTHVVSRDKESDILRPHGHIMRSGDGTWIDGEQFGVTCFAAGIFGAQAYLGNSSFARLLPIVRNALGVTRGGGQRLLVRDGDTWRQLGIPSAFAMTPGDVRWIYRFDGGVLEVRVWCSPVRPASFLEVRVLEGAPREFLITHELVLGVAEYGHSGEIVLHPGGAWAAGQPDPESVVGRQQPNVCFAIAAADPQSIAALGGDELIHADGLRRTGAYVVLRTHAISHGGVIMLGSADGPPALESAVAAARAEYAGEARAAVPPVLALQLRCASDPSAARINDIIPWFNHNAAIHFSAPHGLEQYGGAAWGVRDVTQGSIEWLFANGRLDIARRVIETVFTQQYSHDGTWPQWFMHDPYRFIQQVHSHGDVCLWPVKALCDYVESADDIAAMQRKLPFTDSSTFTSTETEETLWEHCDRVVAHVASRFVPGTALINYGDGDWDDTLQPADPAMRTRMVSAWTVALAYQTFRQLAAVAKRAGEPARAQRLEELIAHIRRDFAGHLMPGGVVAGFLVTEEQGVRPLLHPEDRVTGIRSRLLPMTRSIIAELFTPEQARQHLAIIERELRYPDGVRLMSEPATYCGGLEHWFKRADTAANVGREIGLQYVHAHIRYAEALAKIGDAEGLWHALQVINPVALAEVVPHASPRQSNVYFSSSDADFADRYEAAARWGELRDGRVAVRAGWRLYSSGPGLFLQKVRACLLGVRESFGEVVFDPVLPRSLDGLVASVAICGRLVEIVYRVKRSTHGPDSVSINGTRPEGRRDPNPYRTGGWRVASSSLSALLKPADNRIEIEL